jgi:hypothetical protein
MVQSRDVLERWSGLGDCLGGVGRELSNRQAPGYVV